MKVIICGAGIAGLTLAERMSALGAEVVLVERAAGPQEYGYLVDFFGAGYDAAEAIGVLPAIEAVAHSVNEATLVDEQGRLRADLPYGQIGKMLDGRMCSVLRPDLQKALRDNLPSAVDLRYATSVSAVSHEEDRVVVTLDTGEELAADALVGADGIHSKVRSLVFGPESEYLRYLGFHTAAFVFDASDIAREADSERFVLTDTLDRHMELFFLADGRAAVSAMFATSDPELPSDPRAAVRERFADMGWLIPEVLNRCPPSEQMYYERVAQVEMPQWSKNRVVLIGDACAALSPLAAQGASLAVASAYVLAEQFRTNSSVERAMDFYERLWRWVVEEKQELSRETGGWSLIGGSRRLALRFTWRPLINRFIASTLAGEPTTVIAMLRRGTTESPEG